MKIITIVGAKPQFIKTAAVSRAIEKHNLEEPNQRIEEIIVHTGQHYDHNMSEVFFAQMQIPHPHIQILEPVDYFDMIALLSNCRGVFTDSGGLQKEAYFFHKPCVTLRDETEWVELIEHGFNTLVGADKNRIWEVQTNLKNSIHDYSKPLYGEGNAAQKIIENVLDINQ